MLEAVGWPATVGNAIDAVKRRALYVGASCDEGGFADDAYHGDGCVSAWADGDAQRASWRDGVLHGTSIFSTATSSSAPRCPPRPSE